MTFDFIPLDLYALFFYYAILLTVIVTFLDINERFKESNFGKLFVWILTIYIGFRPVSGKWFGDMTTYNRLFLYYQDGGQIISPKDLFFQIFTKWSSGVMSANFFFLTCAILYIYPLYLVSKKWFNNYWFYSFLLLVASFSFWGAGTNGLRNGIAGSLFLLAISRDKNLWKIVLLVVAIGFHKSMVLPTIGYTVAIYYNKPKHLMLFWLLCIPLSLLGGGFWENLFAGLGFDDERLSYLTHVEKDLEKFSSTGFRWDFLAYSATAVFAGWYFIVIKKFRDKTYYRLFITYVFANSFWILVIRANFSNRFAYLSWFMIALVIIYPFLKEKFFDKQSKIFGQVLIVYFLFTYLMNVLLAK